MDDWVKYVVCFILGWLAARMMGNGFSVGGSEDELKCCTIAQPERILGACHFGQGQCDQTPFTDPNTGETCSIGQCLP